MDPEECQHLFEWHIPVWLVWKLDCVPEDMKVLKEVEVTCPDNIVTDPKEVEVGQVLMWKGVIGLEQFVHPWPETSAESSSSTAPSTPMNARPAASNAASSSGENSNVGVVRMDRLRQHTKLYPPVGLRPWAKPSIIPNPELWKDPIDPAIPPAMSAWHAALKDIVKDMKRFVPMCQRWLTFSLTQSCLAGWITHLSASDVSPVAPCSWWDFLNTIPEQISATFSGDQLCEAASLFGAELIRVQHNIPSHEQFWDLSICIMDLASMDQLTKSKVLWDLYEHNFWFEVVALGHALMPSLSSNWEPEWLDCVHQLLPGDSELTMCTEPFLSQNQGLGSSDPRSKCKFMETFWKLLTSWPWFPVDLVEPLLPSTLVMHVWAVERKLAIFYVQSFFDNFGCPPILPCLIPAALAYGLNSC
ncbi:hypothetical protein EDD16DRAFT_1707913 [Pisolithus croceorrhizus]|nr:hypothetical protein EV401DRAFT_2083988 [Pisolithus croceorrhizus]KAI6117135.1 hypothetical protein EDD16DRAFT_1707913 [Pisolithus croceorrhizus]KAI6158459.1 hypothetical protein EDD17DRAFT_1763808 [Pisolithus thermaeus]